MNVFVEMDMIRMCCDYTMLFTVIFLYPVQTLKQYKAAKLTPIEAGCCRPPSE